MITPAYVRLMAAYNAEMNRRTYAAAGRIGEAERRADRGAFWGSIHGTLNHLLWADRMWMSRFAATEPPAQGIRDSGRLYDGFHELSVARLAEDGRIAAWAEGVDQAWIDQDLVWFSGAMQRQMSWPRTKVLIHFFNHQTHHRGQVHALLTAAGEDTGDTDLPIVLADLERAGQAPR